ncbi:MAG: ATP-binding cassette domain-containing protein [Methanophagales archaeon]|nr:ATP-binding cassette domain-containing protein [Methanophagales archaeon]
MIKIKNLSKDWKEFSLKNINLEIKGGEYFVILGPTGVGKTLLLEAIAGFRIHDGGEVWIEGHDVTNLLPERRRIDFIYPDLGCNIFAVPPYREGKVKLCIRPVVRK